MKLLIEFLIYLIVAVCLAAILYGIFLAIGVDTDLIPSLIAIIISVCAIIIALAASRLK